MRTLLIAVIILFAAIGAAFYRRQSAVNADPFEPEIRKFEESDRLAPPKPGQIVFTGSSSIRLWDTLAHDMKPLDVLNRGFGGSQIADVNHFAPRIVIPYRPRAVVFYCGDNDLAASKSPETVFGDFKEFVQIVHGALPDTWIYFISIKPSTLRWRMWPEMQRANRMIEEFAHTQQRIQFIDVSSAMLDSTGNPKRDLLKADGLHPTPKCYQLWTSIIKPVLMQRFGPEAGAVPLVSARSSSQN